MKKGFTLIELLAVIIILAIIALITIPTLASVIEKARLGAVRDSVYGMIDAAELAYAMDDSDVINGTLTFACDGSKCTTSSGKKLKFKGSVPSTGEISVSKSESDAFLVSIGKYCANGSKNNLEVWKGECQLAPGVYDGKNKLLVSWDDLVNKYKLDIEHDYNWDEDKSDASKNTLRVALQEWNKSQDVKKLVIKEGVTRIGRYAISNAGFSSRGTHSDPNESFTSIILPKSLKEIGSASFDNMTSLKEIIIPDNVEKIGEYAFGGLRLEKIKFGKSLKIIEQNAFSGYHYKGLLEFSNSWSDVSSGAFNGFKFVLIPDDFNFKNVCPAMYSSAVLYNGNYINEGCSEYYYKYNIDGDFIYKGNDKTELLYYKGNSNIVTIPSSVTKINTNAFYNNTSIKKVIISENVREFAGNIFEECSNLEEVKFTNTSSWIYKEKYSNKIHNIDLSNSKENANTFKMHNYEINYSTFIRDYVN